MLPQNYETSSKGSQRLVWDGTPSRSPFCLREESFPQQRHSPSGEKLIMQPAPHSHFKSHTHQLFSAHLHGHWKAPGKKTVHLHFTAEMQDGQHLLPEGGGEHGWEKKLWKNVSLWGEPYTRLWEEGSPDRGCKQGRVDRQLEALPRILREGVTLLTLLYLWWLPSGVGRSFSSMWRSSSQNASGL